MNIKMGYNFLIIILCILISVIVFVVISTKPTEKTSSDVNINKIIKTDNFEYQFETPIYYEDSNEIVISYEIEKKNELYIDNSSIRIEDKKRNKIKELAFDELNNSGEIRFSKTKAKEYIGIITENEIDVLYFKVYLENVIIYDSLDNVFDENKNRDEKIKEVNYFIYLYEKYNYSYDEVKKDINSYLTGSVNKKHKKLVDLIKAEQNRDEQRIEIMSYYEVSSEDISEYTTELDYSLKLKLYDELLTDRQKVYDSESNIIIKEIEKKYIIDYAKLKDLDPKEKSILLREVKDDPTAYDFIYERYDLDGNEIMYESLKGDNGQIK